MDRKTNKNNRRKKRNIDDLQIEQNFSYIAGYTSGGFPYGNPWEETDDDQNEVEDVFI